MAGLFGVDIKKYEQETIQGKMLREISVPEVELFNADLQGISNGYTHPQVREALAIYQDSLFLLARAVMYKASQPYGGAMSLGDEITMRAIRPIDCGIANDYWDWDLTGETPISAVTRINAISIGEEAGMGIIGFLETALDPTIVTAYSSTKGGKTYPYLTLKFTASSKDYAPFMMVQVPILAFPEETLTVNMACARNQTAYTEVIGVAICKAIQFRTVDADIIY